LKNKELEKIDLNIYLVNFDLLSAVIGNISSISRIEAYKYICQKNNRENKTLKGA